MSMRCFTIVLDSEDPELSLSWLLPMPIVTYLSTHSEGKKKGLFFISAGLGDVSEAFVVVRNNESKGPVGPSKGPHVENHSTALCWRKPVDNCESTQSPAAVSALRLATVQIWKPQEAEETLFSTSPLFFLLSVLLNLLFAVMQFLWDTTI